MEGLGLICGHLLGDYILQNDWMAANKTNAWPVRNAGSSPLLPYTSWWADQEWLWFVGHLACLLHCILYTLAVWACSFWWMPWWGLVACFALHFPIDRWRLARWWMVNVSGQNGFATGILAPWSVIIVDNVFHVVTLFVIGVLAQ
jgi:hypothetical protein